MGWALEEDCRQLIGEEWKNANLSINSLTRVQKGLNLCRDALVRWSKRMFTKRDKVIKEQSYYLKLLQEGHRPETMEEIRRVQGDLSKKLEQEDLRWRQQAKRH